MPSESNGPQPDRWAISDDGIGSGITRRSFLRSAMLAAAAIPLASCFGDDEDDGGATTVPGTGGSSVATKIVPTTGPASPVATDALETWNEPWVWRPSEWPGQQLTLNVVENENFGAIVGFGNPSAVLFNYGGATPGPTIRMRGDETLYLRLRNLLGLNAGQTWVGPYPDVPALTQLFQRTGLTAEDINAKARGRGQERLDFCLGEHTNGVHSVRVTNLHTHGLHVRPGRNSDGTHSDNVIFRLIGQDDYDKRQESATDPACSWLAAEGQTSFLREDEQTGYADYEFRLGNVAGTPIHPPGTHWYHPHSHGATHLQVASGMAGFLVIEGDVEDRLNTLLKPDVTKPEPEIKQGPWDYRERMIFVQRVFAVLSEDPETDQLKSAPVPPLVNGLLKPQTIDMRPGAIERWRVLNGSVDGRGFKRFMVLEGQWSVEARDDQAELVRLDGNEEWQVASRREVEDAKQQIYQLAMDGVGLIDASGDEPRYMIADLAEQNAGTTNPLNRPIDAGSGVNPNLQMLENFEACFEPDGIVNCFVRPNEVYMAPANRADILFKAPAEGVYTILARAVVVHADNYQSGLQKAVAPGGSNSDVLKVGPEDIPIAYIAVSGERVEKDLSMAEIEAELPDVPPYLYPVEADEMAAPDGGFRSRTINYSGWGSADYPLITTASDDPSGSAFESFIDSDGGELENLRYMRVPEGDDEISVLLPANIRTMAIDGHKFNPEDPERPRMLLNSAEEWALYNYSIALWANTDTEAHPQPGQYGGHYLSYPVTRREGQSRFVAEDDYQFRLTSRGVDHPFHIHQNPVWVMRIEVPDAEGNLVNILERPRWQDVVWIPRNGGRVVFRSRFPDFVGVYVNHCHILLHEDNGMMQPLEITPFESKANYETRDKVATANMSAEDVSDLYKPLSLEEAWVLSASFEDANHATGQSYPGFVPVPPRL